MTEGLIIFLTALLMFLGVAGSILPVLPGAPLILAGALLYAWHTQFAILGWLDLAVLAVLAAAGQALDYAGSALGARRYGASRWGMFGAFIGSTAGLLTGGLVGLVAGACAGAALLELLQSGQLKNSLRIGYGTLIGLICGAVGKFIVALSMVGYFILQVWR